ncbi:MAG: glycosyltransferase family 9 protein [Muribaculaceae bacterium]
MSHVATPVANSSAPYNKVLIVRFSLLGDVAMTIPVVYSVCVAHPATRFVLVTQKVASTLFFNAPSNLQVVGIDHHEEYRGYRGMLRLAERLESEHNPDAMIDLQGDRRSWLLGAALRLRGSKVMHIDMGNKGKRALTRRRNKRMFPLRTSLDRYREVFRRMGFSFEDTFTSIFNGGKGDVASFAHIVGAKAPGERWIAVAPFAKWQGKIYPMHLMEKALDAIANSPNVRLFFFGQGDNEREQFRKWTEKYRNAISLGEKRNGFPVELALLSHCDVMLSMDNMNMHLASLVRVPVVSVWGASHPYCGFMGWKQRDDLVVQLNMACRPCSLFGDKRCYYNDFFCLTGIQPSMIVTALKRALDEKAPV